MAWKKAQSPLSKLLNSIQKTQISTLWVIPFSQYTCFDLKIQPGRLPNSLLKIDPQAFVTSSSLFPQSSLITAPWASSRRSSSAGPSKSQASGHYQIKSQAEGLLSRRLPEDQEVVRKLEDPAGNLKKLAYALRGSYISGEKQAKQNKTLPSK